MPVSLSRRQRIKISFPSAAWDGRGGSPAQGRDSGLQRRHCGGGEERVQEPGCLYAAVCLPLSWDTHWLLRGKQMIHSCRAFHKTQIPLPFPKRCRFSRRVIHLTPSPQMLCWDLVSSFMGLHLWASNRDLMWVERQLFTFWGARTAHAGLQSQRSATGEAVRARALVVKSMNKSLRCIWAETQQIFAFCDHLSFSPKTSM